jgi:hypothetical protein
MPAPKGNKYWQFRDKHGRDHKYTPEELGEEMVAYCEWIEENPLLEEKGYAYQGSVTKEDFNKLRAMTITGFCLYADISDTTWENYCKQEDFIAVTKWIKNIIYTQKFEGAAADLLNPNIIARDLGLKDRQDIESGGKPIQPAQPTTVTFINARKKKG